MSPYTGSGSGYRIATYQIGGSTNGQLGPGQSFTNIEGSGSFLGNPPSGSYYMTLLVTEYSSTCTASDHFCSDNYENFPTLFTPGQSLTDIASTSYGSSSGSGSTTTGGGSSGTGTTGTGTTGGGTTTGSTGGSSGTGTGTTSTTVTLTDFSNPGNAEGSIVKGPDGNMWYTEIDPGKIGRITPAGVVTEFALSTDYGPGPMTVGPDGNLWFIENKIDTLGKVARITPAGVITEFIPPSSYSLRSTTGITVGPDGNIWFTMTYLSDTYSGRGVGSVSTSGAFSVFLLPAGLYSDGGHLTTDPSGNLWLDGKTGNEYGNAATIIRITPSGSVTSFPTTTNPDIEGIATGADGNVWFTEANYDKIGNISPSGVLKEISIADSFAGLAGITVAPDGNIWFAEGGYVGEMTLAGVYSKYTIPTSGAVAYGITVGPDQNLWVSSEDIYRVNLPGASAPRTGAVFSTSQSDSLSFLRFYNSGATAGTVTVTLSDYTTGKSLGQWTSPTIAAGAAPQYGMGIIETGLSSGVTKPTYYSIAVQSGITGYMQHVLWRPNEGTFTNLSTCNAGVTANANKLNNVHSSAIDSGYPSSIIVNNTGTSAETVSLGIYGATDGKKLGTYATASIPAGGQTIIAMKTIETALSITPGSVGNHYVVKAEGTFTGFLQHLVENVQADVTTDMTTVCSLNWNSVASVASPLKVGVVFSTSQSASQSFLRFYNTGTTAGTVTVTLSDYATGQSLGQWTSPSIAAGASPQYGMGTIESALTSGITKPAYYSVAVQSGITGYMQHVLWRPNQGTFTNLSTCSAGVTTTADKLNNVHSSAIDYGYPSSVIVTNTGTSAETVTLGVYGANDGAKLGTYPTASIPAGGQTIIAMKTIESALNVTPGSVGNHYVVKAEGTFTGFLQHLVQNVQVDVTTDMTTVCKLPSAS